MSHFTFYSADGLEWTQVPENEQFPDQAAAGHEGATYSHDLGFVVVFAGGSGVDYSPDGQDWSSIDVVSDALDAFNLAASGTSIFVDSNGGALILTPTSDCRGC